MSDKPTLAAVNQPRQDATANEAAVDTATDRGFVDPPVDGEVFPPPTSPMAVARQLEPDWQHDGHPTLRHWRQTWMRWQRTHWAEVDHAEVRSALYQRMEHAVFEVPSPDGKGVKRKPWAPTKKKIADLLDALAAIFHLPATVDAPSWADGRDEGVIVACRNGLLRVADRKLLDPDPRFFNLVSVPFDYDPAAPAPERWLTFLRDAWTDDEGNVDQASIDALQEFFGYVVSGRTDLHKILLIVGPTRSGKGTIARVLTALIGKGNVTGPTLASLATNFGLSPLLGKPLAIVSDARLGQGSSYQVVERLLTISGEDTIDVDRKFREPWTGRLPTRFMILSNELPRFGDASGAIAHRFIVLTMRRSWLGKENTSLTSELTAELPGILNWALDGLARLNEQGRFTEPESSVEAVIAMKDDASPMSAFVRECCEVGPGHEVSVDDLYQAWKAWCEDNGRDRPGTVQAFGRNLMAVVPQVRVYRPRDGERRLPRVYRGIKVRAAMEGTAVHCGPGDPFDPIAPTGAELDRDGPRPNPLRPLSEDSAGLSYGHCSGCGIRRALVPGSGKCQNCYEAPVFRKEQP